MVREGPRVQNIGLGSTLGGPLGPEQPLGVTLLRRGLGQGRQKGQDKHWRLHSEQLALSIDLEATGKQFLGSRRGNYCQAT